MKHFKFYLLISCLILLTGCTEEDDKPTRTYWKKDISNLFEIKNNNFYTIYSKKLDIYDIITPEEFQNTTILRFKDELTSFSISKNLLFSSDKDHNFYIVDISDPESPSKIENLNLYPYGTFELQNNYLYATSYKDNVTSINILDLEDIKEPVYRQKFTINDPISMISNQEVLFICESITIGATTYDEKNNYTPTNYTNQLTAYNLLEPNQISPIELDKGIDCGQLALKNNIMTNLSENNLKQYDVTELPPKLLSTINSENMM